MTIHKTSERAPTTADQMLVDTDDGGRISVVIAWDSISRAWVEQTGQAVGNLPDLYTHWFDPKEAPVEPSFSKGD